MELVQINENQYYFQGAVNIGYAQNENLGVLIDAGLDAQTMKKVLKILDQQGMPLTHLFITHAHTDHYGGAAYIQRIKKVHTIAPFLEEAILRYPILEPMYLLQGNKPIDELRNKFLEGEAASVDEIVTEGLYEIKGFKMEFIALPGHSINQLGVKIGDTLFAADSYFGMTALKKHKIPFIVDLEDTLHSLEKLKTTSVMGAVPGHGKYEVNFQQTVQENIDHHLAILHSMREVINQYKDGLSQEEIVRQMCLHWNVKLEHISAWALHRTAITAYVTKLHKDEEIILYIKHHSLWIQKK